MDYGAVAREPFVFYGAYYLSLYTGVVARTLRELADGTRKVGMWETRSWP